MQEKMRIDKIELKRIATVAIWEKIFNRYSFTIVEIVDKIQEAVGPMIDINADDVAKIVAEIVKQPDVRAEKYTGKRDPADNVMTYAIYSRRR